MSPTKLLLALAITAAAAGAHAVPTYSISAPSGNYGLPASFTAVGNAGVATTSNSAHATPAGLQAGGSYLFAEFDGSSITVNNVNASTFSFLWGSPDWYNVVTYNTSLGNYTFTGNDLRDGFGVALDGTGATVFSASLAGGTINSVKFTSSDIAFEFAVAQAVPEPETYALMAAGLMAIGFMARRAKR